MQHVRIFAAVNVSIATIRKLTELQRELQSSQDPSLKVSWVPPPNIHVTLKFYGNILLEQVEAASDALRKTAALVEPFELGAAGLGVFPDPQKPRVLWVGLTAKDGALSKLQEHLEELSHGLGFARDKREYRPHLTVGRIRRGSEGVSSWIEKYQDADCLVSTVREAVLYESRLSRSGAEYVTHCRVPLGKSSIAAGKG